MAVQERNDTGCHWALHNDEICPISRDSQGNQPILHQLMSVGGGRKEY